MLAFSRWKSTQPCWQATPFMASNLKALKPVRAEAVSTQAELGNVRLRIAPWNTEFIDEHCLFPTDGVHDDQVDAVSQAVRYLGGGTRGDDAWAL